MIYKITLKKQLLQIYPCILSSCIVIFIFSLCYFYVFDNVIVFIIWFIVFLLTDLWTILFHIDYLIKNKDCVLEIADDKISFTSKSECIVEQISYIVKIEQYRPVFENEAWVSFKNYYHYKVYFKNGKQIIISSLMIKKIDFSNVPIEIKRRYWPFSY